MLSYNSSMMCIGLWKVSFQKFEEWFGARWTGTLFMSRGSLSCGFCSAGLSFIISRQLARQVCRQWRRLRRRWRTEVFNGAYVRILGLWQHVGESMDRRIKMVYRMSGQVGRWPIQMSDAIGDSQSQGLGLGYERRIWNIIPHRIRKLKSGFTIYNRNW